MNRSTIIAVAILVLLVGLYGGYRVVKHYNRLAVQPEPATITTETAYPSIAPTASASSSATMVTVSKTGFSPQTITIKAGETVTWTNSDTSVHNVSSAMHPTHLVYPPLNLGNITTGQSKSLSFPTAGSFKYHDHLTPSLYGTVVVL